jgi:hypothetical protein
MCPHEEKLTAWLLGDLPPEEHEAMTRHLEGCDACRAVRDDLSRVLSPLRSGLAKDRTWRVAAGTAAPCRPPLWAWLWRRPHEGLKRAALLAVSFGTLFALVSAVYQNAQRERAPAGAITHIEFRKRDEAPAPALEPMPAAASADASPERLAEEAARSVTAISVEREPVPAPALPAPEPRMPELKRLLRTDSPKTLAPSESAADSGGPASVPAARPAKAAAQRDRARTAGAPAPRAPASLQTKPMLLAGATPAPTNAVPTNAAPTNAVAPTTIKRKP